MSEASTPTVVDGVSSTGGQHCETTALGVLLTHAGVELSEPMLFGVGGGLSFIYWDSSRQPFPFLGGRVKPFALTTSLAERLGLDLRVQETSSARRAWDQVRASVDDGIPVGLQLDSHYLDHFGSRVHFAGHVVALYGYDGERAYLVDTAQQGGRVTTSLTSLAAARAAKGPMSASHRSFTVSAPTSPIGGARLRRAAVSAIVACADEFLTPPIANAGHRGIRTAATRVRSLLDRVEDPAHDLPLMGTLMERAGTGGSLFRQLYRDFLLESGALLGDSPESVTVLRGARLFADSGQRWTRVAALFDRAGRSGDPVHLAEAGALLLEIADIETEAMTTLRTLPAS